MTETTCKDDVVLWQETEGIPQPALLIEFFDECITKLIDDFKAKQKPADRRRADGDIS